MDILDHLLKTQEIKSLLSPVREGKNLHIHDLWGSSKAILAGVISKALKKPVVIVVKGPKELERMAGELETVLQTRVYQFPGWEILPDDNLLPTPEIIADRFVSLGVLSGLSEAPANPIIVADLKALMFKTISPDYFRKQMVTVKRNASLDFEATVFQLVRMGYERVDMVERKGEFSLRGGILDVYPINTESPVRIELSGETIESIRDFNPITQRSLEARDGCAVFLGCEVELIRNFPKACSLFADYIPAHALLCFDEPVELDEAAQTLERPGEKSRDISSDFVSGYEKLARFQKIFLSNLPQSCPWESTVAMCPLNSLSLESFQGREHTDAARPFNTNRILDEFQNWVKEDYSIYLYCNNEGEEKRLKEIFEERGTALSPSVVFLIGRLDAGVVFPGMKTVVVTDQEIFGRYKVRRRRRKFQGKYSWCEFSDIQPGDYVVHINHGIGKYRGIKEITHEGIEREMLLIEYRDKARLYVPVEQANLVDKYIGLGSHPPQLDKLGGTHWKKRKLHVERAITDLAAELLEVQSARASLKGTSFATDVPWQKEFEAAFIYEETPDQEEAITAVKKDLESEHPMDRLICGDAGYGKTEVAIRAAFKCVMQGKQVAVLVPTTLLAQQHYHTFSDRLADYPIRVEMLSRFRSPAEQKKIIEAVKQGVVDIVIGTHRLIQKDIGFKDLGLVVIDEEQRFGVEHKERFKKLRMLVDVLTLSATPIPRTLYLSIMGAREMSIINTPPEDRLPIETIVAEFTPEVVNNAIRRELNRDGQVFYVHNRIASIEKVREQLATLIPEATIMTAHGQMNEGELAAIMELFTQGKIDVLICTTIIESGLDIPNVNTIIIDKSERFGLADLYQLRGRVGRFRHKAYAYFLISRDQVLIETARKRIKAIKEFTGFGHGFKLALRDLEIRGAGNILGKEQHGHIYSIGFELYCRLLKRGVERLKGHPVKDEIDVAVRLEGCSPSIPLSYIPDQKQRLDLYRRIAQVSAASEMEEIMEEVKDRYGNPPEELFYFFEMVLIRIVAMAKKISSIELKGNSLVMKVHNKPVLHKKLDVSELPGKHPQKALNKVKKVLSEI